MKSLCFLIIICIFPLCGIAQNNPYKINDNLYGLFMRANVSYRNTDKENVIDSLYTQALLYKDIKAQCIALYLKSQAATYHNPYNETHHIEAVKRACDFSFQAHYNQYAFASMESLVRVYINEQNYAKALDVMKSYQKYALDLNDPRSIAASYILLGKIYLSSLQYRIAIKQFKNAINILEKSNIKEEMHDAYLNCGRAFANLDSKSDSVYYYLDKSYETSITDARRGASLYQMINIGIYSGIGFPWIEPRFAQLKKLVKEKHINLGYAYAVDYISLRYYLYKNDLESAKIYVENLKKHMDVDDVRLQVMEYYVQNKEFEKAYFLSRKISESHIDKLTQTQSLGLNALTAQFDNAKLTIEKQKLEIQNQLTKNQRDQFLLQSQQSELARMDAERIGLLTRRERDSLDMNYRTYRIQTDSIEQKHRQDDLIQRADSREKQLIFIIIVVVLVLISALTFVVTKIHGYKKLQIEKKIAEDAMNEAKKADNLKSEFLNNMSHEIRTPLNAIVGFTDVLNGEMSEFLSEDEKKDLIGLVHTNTNLLTTLINDILELSRLQSGNYKLNIEEVNLSVLCSEAVSSVLNRVPEGVKMFFDGNKDEQIIISDRNRITQVVTNFLTNACKYTESGQICLAYQLNRDGNIDISVTDTGCGIPTEYAEEIFNRFEKLGSFKQGTGLGLNICLNIAKLLGGSVWLDTSYTGGSRFVFTLPSKYNG